MDIFLDVETSGLNNYKNGIWQIAALIYDEDGNEITKFNGTCEIFSNQEWDRVAQQMAEEQGYFEDLHVKPTTLFGDFIRTLEFHIDPYNSSEKLTMYAYNASFDEKFLRSFFYNNDNRYFGSYFWKPVIDVMSLAGEHLKEERAEMENFKQGTVAKHLGIPVDEEKQHDALYDIRLMRQIYKELK